MEHHLVILVVSFRRRLSFERLAQHKLEHLAKYGRLKVFRAHLSEMTVSRDLNSSVFYRETNFSLFLLESDLPPPPLPILTSSVFFLFGIFLRVSPHFFFIREEKDVKKSSKICTYQPLEIYVYFKVASLFI